jgi:hypothetical protein
MTRARLSMAGWGLAAGALAACSEDAITKVEFGSASVSIATTGTPSVPDGYSLTLDGGTPLPVKQNDQVALPGLKLGTHHVGLGGLPDNCVLLGPTSLALTVTSRNPAASVSFTISCLTFGVLEPVSLTTYEGSGQVVHPDIAVTPDFQQSPLWLGITPYPNGNASFENPSIFQGSDLKTWQVPNGLANPIAKPAAGQGYNSDPDLIYRPDTREILTYFRQVVSGKNRIQLSRTHDGVTWSSPQPIIEVPNHQLVSPAVVRGAPQAPWQMWSVNAGSAGCSAQATFVERRTSSDGVVWDAPEPVDLTQPGLNIWHLEVQWIPSRHEYWALYNVYAPPSTCVTPQLYLARSSDGVTWETFPSPLLSAGAIPEFQNVVYRSTFEIHPAQHAVTFWFSGAKYENKVYVWHAATVTRRIADVLAQVRRPAPASAAELFRASRFLPPPEPADTLP